jgi:hypothetical protein
MNLQGNWDTMIIPNIEIMGIEEQTKTNAINNLSIKYEQTFSYSSRFIQVQVCYRAPNKQEQ